VKRRSIFLVALMLVSYLQGQTFNFRNVGPSRGGRATAVEGVDDQPNLFYMGATGGGLWKSEDYGIHWENISDGFFSTPSIGAISVYQRDPSIIYVGTGSEAIRSNVILGKGIYKSSDSGETWEFMGLKNAGQIGAIEVHPENPDKVYAAVVGQPFRKSKERGVYRSVDGGDTWEQILFHSDSVGAVDLEFAPDNPDVIYVSMWRGERKPWTIISGGATDGIFKSVDGGDTWKRLTSGLPTSLFGKSDLAVSMDIPARVWAQIQASEGQEGIYKSDDYGETWAKIEMPSNVHKSIMYRPFYFTNIDANPKNADNIWAGTKLLWTSYDGGKSWKRKIPPHADHHDLWMNPNDTSIVLVGNDGGGAVSRDGGRNWSHQFNQPTAELYTCDVDDQYPYYVYSGQQDNSTIRVPSRSPDQNALRSNDNSGLEELMYWERVGGCETGPAIPKPGDPNIVYSNCKGQFSVYNHTLGTEHLYYIGAESLYGNHPDDITYRFQRVTPMEVSPHDPNTVYYGSQFLHKTTDGGKTWQTISGDLTANLAKYRMHSGGPIDEDISGEEYYAVLYAIQESPVQKGVLWTGSNDGLVHVSKDGGTTWVNVTPDMPAGGRVSNIEASPHDAAKAYFAVYRDYLGDETPYLYKTNDYGVSWELTSDASSGFPSGHPVRAVREDTEREGLLFAGTEFGLFISFDDGATWLSFQQNLPIVPITDMQVYRNDLILSTLGRSFWILDDISPLRQFAPGNASFRLFAPKEVIEPNLQLYFQLPETQTQSDSSVVFEFKKGEEVIHSKTENLNQLPVDEWGMRKTEWDLHYYLKNGDKDFKGPRVVPGRYQVSLTYNGQKRVQDLHVSMNPELESSGVRLAELQEQQDLALRVAKLYLEIETTIRDLETKAETTRAKKKKATYHALLAKLQKGKRRYDQPMLIDHVDYLYDLLSEAQQPSGTDAARRYEALHSQWVKFKQSLK